MPLASKLRPTKIEDFIGQDHLIGEKGPLRKMIESNNIQNMIFWGPPASGKTTLAKIISNHTNSDFIELSAVMDGKADLKKVVERAEKNKLVGTSTILFVDEIHRWSKSQQDALLPYTENGSLILIGATTENPSFTVISPLLSRSRVFVFYPHTEINIITGIERGLNFLNDEKKLDKSFENDEIKKYLAELSNGDIRFALNSLELCFNITKDNIITQKTVEDSVQKSLRYDKKGDEHYNIISAVHKSLRSSNPTAACYWIMRMLMAGDDPLYVARRLVRFASEDIGNANTNALLLANVVYDTCHKLGMPECDTALMQLAEYLAKSPKNNSAYVASTMAKEDITQYGNLEVPLHIRNAPTKLMKDLGYSKGYEYDHDLKNKKSDQQCMPDKLKDKKYFS